MKTHELARLLLETPNVEVFVWDETANDGTFTSDVELHVSDGKTAVVIQTPLVPSKFRKAFRE